MAEQIETPVSRRLSSVKNILIVLSGKGGVGKSSSSVQLALSLLNTSPTARVGLLDLDLTGPSLPRMVGLDLPGASVHQSSAGWVPVYVDQGRRLGVMSIGFLLKDRGDSVVWRGPKKDGMIRQFLSEVRWGELDYLVIDTPPGMFDFSYDALILFWANIASSYYLRYRVKVKDGSVLYPTIAPLVSHREKEGRNIFNTDRDGNPRVLRGK
jgi:Mrp family chromosome partitioning ATPase